MHCTCLSSVDWAYPHPLVLRHQLVLCAPATHGGPRLCCATTSASAGKQALPCNCWRRQPLTLGIDQPPDTGGTGTLPSAGAATRAVAERGGHRASRRAAPRQAQPPRGAATRETAERGGVYYRRGQTVPVSDRIASNGTSCGSGSRSGNQAKSYPRPTV